MRALLILLLCAVFFSCQNGKKSAEIVLKDNPVFERYAPKLQVESKYLLVNLADEIKPDSTLENGDWHFTVDVPDEGGYYCLLDMVIYLKPGSRLYIEHNERHRYKSVFKGDTEQENRWLNQQLLRMPDLLRKFAIREGMQTFPSYKQEIDATVDSLGKDLRARQWDASFVENVLLRLDLAKAKAYCMYVQRKIGRQRYGGGFQDGEGFETWKNEQMAIVRPLISRQVVDILQNHTEEQVVNCKQGIDAVLELESLEKGSLYSLGYSGFQELYDYHATKLYDPAFAYSSELKSFVEQVKDQRLREAMMKLYGENKFLLEGAAVQDFEFEDAEGVRHRLAEFRGTPVYIDVWATWCNPCIALSPYFEELAKRYKGKDIKFVAISIDKKASVWQKHLSKSGGHSNVTEWRCVNEKFLETYQITGIPRFIL